MFKKGMLTWRLREEHDRCYEDLVMDQTWRFWEDIPYEKRGGSHPMLEVFAADEKPSCEVVILITSQFTVFFTTRGLLAILSPHRQQDPRVPQLPLNPSQPQYLVQDPRPLAQLPSHLLNRSHSCLPGRASHLRQSRKRSSR